MLNSTIFFLIFCLIFAGYVLIFLSVAGESRPGKAGGNHEVTLVGTIESQNRLILDLEEQLVISRRKSSAVAQSFNAVPSAPAAPAAPLAVVAPPNLADAQKPTVQTNGVIILGMHRSGTSILGGLVNKMGLKTGGPLIQPGSDNEKGFYERLDVVLQNDYLMKKQGVHYGYRTEAYDAEEGAYHALLGMRGGGTASPKGTSTQLRGGNNNNQGGSVTIDANFFNEGKRGLAFLNNPSSYPWLLKDPRLCITLRTWLPLLKEVPAVLFTYRHPMDVALSLQKREQEHYRIGKGLRMWYVYNMRAILQSNDLCRVVGSHRKMMASPNEELHRMRQELMQRCGVAVPRDVTQTDVSEFIDLKLQHGHNTQADTTTCQGGPEALRQAVPPTEQWPTTDPTHLRLYREVMRVYCALEDGSAFLPHFAWDLSMKDA